jgi:NSS family neurotransmitter:Na+ symporter
MVERLEEQRENWGTRTAFILAAIGSAVGLGNLWGFPYKLYSFGGAAFLIPYALAVFCIGLPLLILELSLGHFTQRAAPDAFKRVNRRLEFVGWWGLVLTFLIITYYPIILAYCFSYLGYSIQAIVTGTDLPWAGHGIEGVKNAESFFYNTFLGHTDGYQLGALRSNLIIPLALTWLAMYLCIFRGLKLVGKIIWFTVPLPFLMLIVLMIRGLTLPGSSKGITFYLDPVWMELTKPVTWRYAFGQVFFSLTLAFGVMVTYASFLHKRSDINNNAAIICISDFGTSFVAGLAIFATLGGMAHVTQQANQAVAVQDVVAAGPGLAFVAFPYTLAQLPAAPWWSAIFFFTLVTLGIDSAFSMTEAILAGVVDKTGWKRCVVLPVISVIGFGLGLFYITGGGLNWLGAMDGFVNGTWGIAFIGLLECVVIGWLYDVNILRKHANDRSDWRIGYMWNHSLRTFVPLVLGTLFFWSLLDDFHTPGGYFKTEQGPNLFNIVGVTLISLAPVVAVSMCFIKSRVVDGDSYFQLELEDRIHPFGKKRGLLAFTGAMISSLLVTLLIFTDVFTGHMFWLAVCFAAGLGFAVLLLSNFLAHRCSGSLARPSWFIKLAGISSIVSVSGALAVILLEISASADHVVSKPVGDHLTSTSYLILAFVFLILTFGLGWCIYRAAAAGKISQASKNEKVL